MLRTRVEAYYRLVDAEDFESMLALFSEDIRYKRCEEEISGMEALRIFYLEERKIKGRHVVDRIVIEGDGVVVRGVFEKIGGKNLGFSDHFDFDKDGKIRERRTYLDRRFVESTE